jgi:hypothetical protein
VLVVLPLATAEMVLLIPTLVHQFIMQVAAVVTLLAQIQMVQVV